MVLNAITAFVGESTEVTPLNIARRLVHTDFKKAGIRLGSPEKEDLASEMIARLLEQEIDRAVRALSDKQ